MCSSDVGVLINKTFLDELVWYFNILKMFIILLLVQFGKAVPASAHEIFCLVSASEHLSVVPSVQVLVCV